MESNADSPGGKTNSVRLSQMQLAVVRTAQWIKDMGYMFKVPRLNPCGVYFRSSRFYHLKAQLKCVLSDDTESDDTQDTNLGQALPQSIYNLIGSRDGEDTM